MNKGASNWNIVADESGPNRHGAEELQRFLFESSGAKLPITTRFNGKVKSFLIFTDSRLTEEEFTVKTTPYGIEIRGGGKRGALYGCYGFLETILGFRWFTKSISRIPKYPSIVTGSFSLHDKPAFEYREPYFTEALDKDWDLRNRVNGSSMPLDESVGGKIQYGRFVHTFAELVPPEK